MAAITPEEREKFLQLMQDYNKSIENKAEVEVITADEMDDAVSMPGVKGSYDSVTGEFKPEKYVQAPMSAFAKPAKDAAAELQEKMAAFEKAISDAETVLVNMQNATEDARGIVKTATDAAESVRQTLEDLKGVEVNAERLAQDVATADTLLQNLEAAIQQAQTVTSNANTQAEYAKENGDYAKTQGDRVNAQILDITKEKQAAIDAASNANIQASNAKSIYEAVSASEAERVAAETKRVTEMEELNSHPVKMGDNGNWWMWDLTIHAYADTGVLAKGGILYPTFDVDLDDGGLYMYGTSETTENSFEFSEADGALYYLPRTQETI